MTAKRRKSQLRAAWVGAVLALCSGLAAATTVRFETVRGPVDIELYDTQAPLTVANFLSYVRKKAYDASFFHRSVPGFVVQGGGYTMPPLTKIPADAPVKNEFSSTRSNLRGTVAMAKLGGNPDSATTEWFVNLADNAANLDNQNGGFTVFGRVTAPGMVTMDAIAALPYVNASSCGTAYGALGALPLQRTITTCAEVNAANLVMVSSARELPPRATDTASDRIFNYLEAAYPQYASPSSPASGNALGYYYRYYSKTNAYAGTKDGGVYYLVPGLSPDVQWLGSIADWLAIAAAAGY